MRVVRSVSSLAGDSGKDDPDRPFCQPFGCSFLTGRLAGHTGPGSARATDGSRGAATWLAPSWPAVVPGNGRRRPAAEADGSGHDCGCLATVAIVHPGPRMTVVVVEWWCSGSVVVVPDLGP